MKSNRNAEKIRQRKIRLRQINGELSLPAKRRKTWLWFLVAGAPFIAVSVLIFLYKENFSVGGSNYETLMLPIALASALLLLLIMWLVPKFYVRSLQNKSLGSTQSEFDREKEKLKLEDDTRKTVAQILGGAVFLLGLIFTFNTYNLNVEKQDLDREGQITDRFTKAVSQLGSQDTEVRLGGLYALERIAKDSEKDHWTIMEILSSYVHEKSPLEKLAEKMKTNPNELDSRIEAQVEGALDKVGIKTDVQAAVTIMGRSANKQLSPQNDRIDLSRTNLIGANLVEAKFNRINLTGADLSFAAVVETDLSDAFLNRTSFYKANLTDAKLNGAALSKGILKMASLVNADLSNGYFRNSNFENANFKDANVKGADFRGANLRSTNLTYEQIITSIIDETTELPDLMKPYRQEFLVISEKNLEEKEKKLKGDNSPQ